MSSFSLTVRSFRRGRSRAVASSVTRASAGGARTGAAGRSLQLLPDQRQVFAREREPPDSGVGDVVLEHRVTLLEVPEVRLQRQLLELRGCGLRFAHGRAAQEGR